MLVAAVLGMALGAVAGLHPLETIGRPTKLQTAVTIDSAIVSFQTLATLPFSDGPIALAAPLPGQAPAVALLHPSPPSGNVILFSRESDAQYTERGALPPFLSYAFCDLDCDGRAELLGQFADTLLLYKAIDRSSLPTSLAWDSPLMSNIEATPLIADSDGDGRMEILYSENHHSGPSILHILENTGDNAFSEVFAINVGPGDIGRKLVCDLDGDGSIEIVMSGSRGKVSILESIGDNAWALRWRYDTGLQGAYGVAGGSDGDGNGRPEVLVTGSVFAGWRTVVIEATCNNYYAERTRLEAAVGGSGLATVIADIDGRPPYEFLAFSLGGIAVWRPRTNGQWDMIGTIPDPNLDHAEHISVADMNKNGRDEIFWGGLVTTVYEAAGTTSTGPPEQRTVNATRLRVTPNPCRGECTLSFLGAAPPCDTRLEIYDVAGRIVSSLQGPTPATATVRWTPHFASGRYFLQARTSQGRTIAPHVALVIAK